MKPKINYHYSIPYKEVNVFEFKKYNDVVDLTSYYFLIIPRLLSLSEQLLKNPNSRQEVIVVHSLLNKTCLISLQFLIIDKELVMIANYRSQCEKNGRPIDTQMLRYVATQVMRRLELERFKIYVNVGHYHINKGQENNFGCE